MTPEQVISQLKDNLLHSRYVLHDKPVTTTEKQLLYQLLANQIIIMEALAKLQPISDSPWKQEINEAIERMSKKIQP